MSEPFEQVLEAGGKANSLGRSSEVVEDVLASPSRLPELFDCIYADDDWVRMRAIDSFEKVIKGHPDWAEPYIDKIFDDLTCSDQPSIQWHLAQLFTEIKLSDAQRSQAIDWLKHKLKTVEVDWIVAGDCMKALLYFYKEGYLAKPEVDRLFAVQEGHSSKAIRAKAGKLREALRQLP